MNKWIRIVAAVVAVAAVALLAYAVLTPQPTTTTDHNGMMGHSSYSATNVGLIALSIVLIVAALMVMALWKEYEPLPPSMAPPQALKPAIQQAAGEVEEPAAEEPPAPEPAGEEETAAREYLILRLLTGDERTMFKAIMDSGGEALQKDLIARTKMSNAKVSRILDRLEQKGVVTKERYGSTNKIRVKPE